MGLRLVTVLCAVALVLPGSVSAQALGIIGTQKLPPNCTNGQVPVYNTTTLLWECAAPGATLASPTFTGQVQSGSGTVGAPSYSFPGGNDGFWANSTSSVGVSINGTFPVMFGGSGIYQAADALLIWTATNNSPTATADLILVRAAANTLALRNGAADQAFRVNGLYTDASNYHYGSFAMSDTALTVSTSTLGTGVDNLDIILTPSGTGTVKHSAPMVTGGSVPSVANVGANSCGTTSATIAGNDNSFEITVGATAGTQCRVTFTTTAPVRWNCDGNNDTTVANLVSAKAVDTTHVDFYGTFVALDVITAQCSPR